MDTDSFVKSFETDDLVTDLKKTGRFFVFEFEDFEDNPELSD